MRNDYAERDKQTVRDFLRFLQERRMDDWIGLWAEDGVNIYPYHSGLLPERLEGKKAIFEVWKTFWFSSSITRVRLKNT